MEDVDLRNKLIKIRENQETVKTDGKRKTVTTLPKTKERYDIEYKGIHTFRHTFASRLFRNGIDVPTVSKFLECIKTRHQQGTN